MNYSRDEEIIRARRTNWSNCEGQSSQNYEFSSDQEVQLIRHVTW